VREEINRKRSILGFYGVTPEVEILLQDFALPMRHLVFFLVGGPAEGSFRVSFEIFDGSKQVVPRTPDTMVVIEGAAKGYNLTVDAGAIHFPRPGRYTFRLFVDGQSYFEDSFGLLQAGPGELK
jgi:hypothetical protein